MPSLVLFVHRMQQLEHGCIFTFCMHLNNGIRLDGVWVLNC